MYVVCGPCAARHFTCLFLCPPKHGLQLVQRAVKAGPWATSDDIFKLVTEKQAEPTGPHTSGIETVSNRSACIRLLEADICLDPLFVISRGSLLCNWFRPGQPRWDDLVSHALPLSSRYFTWAKRDGTDDLPFLGRPTRPVTGIHRGWVGWMQPNGPVEINVRPVLIGSYSQKACEAVS